MSTIDIYLLRHGNTFETGEIPYQVGCKTDLPLTVKGLEQAQAFVEYLKSHNIKPDAIYGGGLSRQTQTAQIIQATFGDAQYHLNQSAFDEIDYGPWEGLTVATILQLWPLEHDAWEKYGEWPAFFGKGKDHHMQLLTQWIKSLDKTENKTIIAVTSNGIMRLINQLLDNPVVQSKVKTGHFCHLQKVQTSNNSILKIINWDCTPAFNH